MKSTKRLGLTVRRMAYKAKRELLHLPIISAGVEWRYETRKAKHAPLLPDMPDEDWHSLEKLRRQGVFLTNVAELGIPNTEAMLKTAELFFQKRDRFLIDGNRQSIPNQLLQQYPDLYLWGLEERLLALVENYLELPVLYLGAEVKIEPANGLNSGVRQWHVDIEDHRMVKVIIYCNDVDLNGGPFQYISREETQAFIDKTDYKAGLISNATMALEVPTDRWLPCLGPAHTVIITDPCSVLHQVRVPVQRDRHSVTFNYCSRFPFEFRSKHSLSRHPSVLERLSPRQIACALS